MSKEAAPEAVLNQLAQDIHETAVLKTFWHTQDPFLSEINTKLMLIVSEVAEAQEVLREEYRGKVHPYTQMTDEQLAKFIEELADVIIRAFDLARYFTNDLGAIVTGKMAKNRDRPPKHGKRF